jgi:predicted nucleotidyltransferase
MHLLPDQLLFGVAPALLVDCARQIHDRDWDEHRHSIDIDAFSKALGAPIGESAPVLQAMLEAGFFEPADGTVGRYLPTRKLGQLALASISPGISRQEADALLAQIVEKAGWVNARSDQYDHRIACVVVFGSYLTDKPHLGDLDIGVSLEELRDRRRKNEGEDIYAWLRRAGAARNRALRALRLRQPKKISVHKLDEVIGLNTPYRVVFGTLPS